MFVALPVEEHLVSITMLMCHPQCLDFLSDFLKKLPDVDEQKQRGVEKEKLTKEHTSFLALTAHNFSAG